MENIHSENVELLFLLSVSFTEDSAMTSRVQRERERAFLKDQDAFRRNACKLIFKMRDLMMVECINADVPREQAPPLLDEMLHSIFFLGKVNKPTFSPESILKDENTNVVYEELKTKFPLAFELSSSHLPRRSPFSCVLDMIVLLKGQEREILSGLRKLIIELKLRDSRELISSTICVSHRTDVRDPVKYYGVSMAAPTASKKGPFPRRFLIAASCLNYWDECVDGAVLTYSPNKQRKRDYDGTIQLPQGVRCQAFSLKENRETPPCLSCRNLFGLRSNSQDVSVYGNCAEAESLSNLFENENDVKKRARPTSAKYSDEKRDGYRRRCSKDLQNSLKANKFTWREGDFYIPS